MERVLWPLAFVVTFVVGVVAGRVIWYGDSAVQEAAHEQTVTRLEERVGTLQAQIRSQQRAAGTGPSATTTSPASAAPRSHAVSTWLPPGPLVTATVTEAAPASDSAPGGGTVGRLQPGAPAERAQTRPAPRPTPATSPTMQAALDRFHRYLEAASGPEGRERWQQMRALVDELRAMGDVAGQALMQVLASATDSEERRTAARLLGALQVSQAAPLFQDVIQNDVDVMMRRAAASALRQLRSAEALPFMERLVTTPAEDRFVRLSAAVGLADAGRPIGVSALAQIFEETAADGRGREIAFRALTALKDDRPLPVMRHIVASEAEPGYRIRAIRYLGAQGDRQSIETLRAVMQSPNEPPSVRDAAAQAYAAIRGR